MSTEEVTEGSRGRAVTQGAGAGAPAPCPLLLPVTKPTRLCMEPCSHRRIKPSKTREETLTGYGNESPWKPPRDATWRAATWHDASASSGDWLPGPIWVQGAGGLAVISHGWCTLFPHRKFHSLGHSLPWPYPLSEGVRNNGGACSLYAMGSLSVTRRVHFQ